MNRNKNSLRKLLALALFVIFLLHAPLALACGPFTLTAVFTFNVHPEYPLASYAQGKLGVIEPTYARSYLYAAYRHLSGIGFNSQEQEALVSLWRDRLEYRWDDGEKATEVWLTARKQVPNVPEVSDIEVFRNREKPNEYEQYLNCASDAFQTAATTLTARIQKLGANNTAIYDWVTAQDQVFANCSEGTHIPAAAPEDADELIEKDRTYQMAAANFYSGNYGEARKLLTTIKDDRNSPWQSTAQYLIARTWVREASLGPTEGRDAAHAAAEKELNQILQDPAQSEWHTPARRLLNLVLLRYRPEERVQELAKSLLAKNNASLKQELWDYTVILDHYMGDDSTETKQAPAAVRADDLNDWIITFQDQSPEAAAHANKQWQARGSLPWLVAAISKAGVSDLMTSELLESSAKVTPDSPAFPTIFFHTIRLSLADGHFRTARSKLDELLSSHRERLTVAGTNLFENQRMLLATDLDDFLKHAQRMPAAFSWDDDGRELPTDDSDESEETKALRGKTLFDTDTAVLFNRWFPLRLWRQAAESNVLPTHLRRDVAQAAWLRAVLLNDSPTALALIPTLKAQLPELTPFLDDYTANKRPDAQKFSAIYLWLKFPGLEPVVDAGVGRPGKPAEQDTYRDNWWCTAAFQPPAETLQAEANQMKPTFLTPQDLAIGKAESDKLNSLGAAPNLIAREVISWANKNPNDPRVPEALHLAVKTTRFGCTDKDSARWSKSAFDLLHRRYPGNVWTKRTPYWFKD